MFFQQFWTWLTSQLTDYIANKSAAVAGAIEPAVVTLATIYVMIWGFLSLTGRIQEPIWEGVTSTARMIRSFAELVSWLVRDNPVPPGSVLLTGTGLVPPDTFTLLPGHIVHIHVPGIGTLSNHVVLATDLARN